MQRLPLPQPRLAPGVRAAAQRVRGGFRDQVLARAPREGAAEAGRDGEGRLPQVPRACGRRDMEPIAFDRHCASCHAKDGSLGLVEPVPQEDVVAPADLAGPGRLHAPARGVRRRAAAGSPRRRCGTGTTGCSSTSASSGASSIPRASPPSVARSSRARRSCAAASPLPRPWPASTSRPCARAIRSSPPSSRASRRASRTRRGPSGRPPASTAWPRSRPRRRARTRRPGTRASGSWRRPRRCGKPAAAAAALPAAERESRRRELLTLLDAIEAADPQLAPRAEDLRRRLLALSAGESPAELLARVRDQRAAERARVADEIALRASGVQPATDGPRSPASSGRSATRSLRCRRSSRDWPRCRSRRVRPATSACAASGRRSRSLSAACRKCHVVTGAALAPVSVARPRLVRASFVHAPHLLQADCARCHAGVEQSKESADLNLKGIASCRDCHRARAARADCRPATATTRGPTP